MKLKKTDLMPIFNDLLILQLIATELPKKTLRQLLIELKHLMVSLES